MNLRLYTTSCEDSWLRSFPERLVMDHNFFLSCAKWLFIAVLAFPILVMYASALSQAVASGITRGIKVVQDAYKVK